MVQEERGGSRGCFSGQGSQQLWLQAKWPQGLHLTRCIEACWLCWVLCSMQSEQCMSFLPFQVAEQPRGHGVRAAQGLGPVVIARLVV